MLNAQGELARKNGKGSAHATVAQTEEQRLAELMGEKRASFVVNTETDLEGANTVGKPFRGEIDMTLAQSNILVDFCTLNFPGEGKVNDFGNTLTVPHAKNIPNATETAEKLDNSVNEVQDLSITGTPTGGSFTITFTPLTSAAETTAAIPFDATPAQVKAALELFNSISNVAATLGPLPGTAIEIEFINPPGNVNLMTTTDSLTGGTTPASAIVTSTPGVDSTATVPQTDIEFDQRVITAHKIKQSVKCSNEWRQDTVDVEFKLRWLGKSVGGGQLELITPDVLAGVVDSGITPAAIDSGAILGLIAALPVDYLRLSPAWMARPSIITEMRTAMASFANSWEPAMRLADGSYTFPTLEGYPVLPNIFSPATGANTIVFGDFSKVHLWFPDGRRSIDSNAFHEFVTLTVFGERFAETAQVLAFAIGRCGAGVSVAGSLLGFNKTP